ncbi:SpoVG family protein [Phosphitispora sp. TUW77]|uniref:SpoVG family protein n=1 Tax=Phosphitispora sp. TUW77 TaxID=3152361 RepID=UPI003AB3E002
MNITEVRIKRSNGDSKIRAFASVTIDDALVVHDIKVVEGKNGLFVAMPSKKVGEKYIDISHPITGQSRSALFDAVLSKYSQEA